MLINLSNPFSRPLSWIKSLSLFYKRENKGLSAGKPQDAASPGHLAPVSGPLTVARPCWMVSLPPGLAGRLTEATVRRATQAPCQEHRWGSLSAGRPW